MGKDQSMMAVLLGAIADISIGRLLVGIIMPGLLMAALYALYIVGRCQLQKSIAPPYKVEHHSLLKKLENTVRYIVPLGFIIFLVIGVIMLGVATPSEAAACGAVGTFILAICYRRLSWDMITKTFSRSMSITCMVFLIVAAAITFGQILSFSGASSGLIKYAGSISLSPIWILISMQVVVLIMGMFMPSPAIVMVAMPLFMPIVESVGFNPVWFGVVTLMNLEVATTSPPFGSSLFVMKGVAPAGTTIGDCYRAALPFIYCDIISMIIVIAFPAVALWLPGIMMR